MLMIAFIGRQHTSKNIYSNAEFYFLSSLIKYSNDKPWIGKKNSEISEIKKKSIFYP